MNRVLRSRKKNPTTFRVTKFHATVQPWLLCKEANKWSGPKVAWDKQRGCYGLKADRRYKKGEKITTYGGYKSVKPMNGDYVAKSGEVYIDGFWGFFPHEKGRWINESDALRKVVNVNIARTVRATCDIEEGEWLFGDYGNEYVRNY